MKKTIILQLIVVALFVAGNCQAQSLSDLLNKSNVEKVVNAVTGKTAEVNLAGTWNYTGVAIAFESDNLLAKAGGSVAASTVEKKMDEQLSKLGIKAGQMSFTFNADSTFTAKVGAKSVNGKYSYNADDSSVKLKFAKIIPVSAKVSYTSTKTDLLFNVDKLLTIVKYLASKSSNSTLKSISSLAENYDGMRAGFALEKAE